MCWGNQPLSRGRIGPLRYKWAGRLSRSERTSVDFSHTWEWVRVCEVWRCLVNTWKGFLQSVSASSWWTWGRPCKARWRLHCTLSVSRICAPLTCDVNQYWKCCIHPILMIYVVYDVMKNMNWNITSKSKVISPPTHSVWSRCQRLPCSRGWCWATPLRCTGPQAPRFPLPPSMLQQIQNCFRIKKTLPKAQRTRGLSSYYKFLLKFWSNIIRISNRYQLQNINQTWTSQQVLSCHLHMPGSH